MALSSAANLVKTQARGPRKFREPQANYFAHPSQLEVTRPRGQAIVTAGSGSAGFVAVDGLDQTSNGL